MPLPITAGTIELGPRFVLAPMRHSNSEFAVPYDARLATQRIADKHLSRLGDRVRIRAALSMPRNEFKYAARSEIGTVGAYPSFFGFGLRLLLLLLLHDRPRHLPVIELTHDRIEVRGGAVR